MTQTFKCPVRNACPEAAHTEHINKEPQHHKPAHSPDQSVLQGIKQALPIIIGFLPVGFAYGVLARKSGIPELHTVLMSLIVFAGSAQFIAVSLISAGAAPITIIITTFIVNLRHMLMSAALAPHLRNWSAAKKILFGFQLTDESFALHVSRFQKGRRAPGETLALNMTGQVSWIFGTVLGVFGSTLVGDVRPLGLDYALIAMFIILLMWQTKTRLHVLIAIVAGVLSTVFALAGAGQWNVILATVAGASIGLLLKQREN